MKFGELNFPSGLNLKLLSSVISENKLKNFIKENAGKSRRERRIVLPSHRCISKVIAYYYGKRVEEKEMNWSEVMKILKTAGGLKDLISAGLERKEIKRLYKQRCREIKGEKRSENK